MPAEIAVVIPTHRRETRLSFALDALAAQTLDPARFEVVVVRSPETETEAAATAPAGLDVRFLSSEEANISGQRNLGWRATEAPLVAFTDDDCRPAPDWLERLANAAADGADGILVGRTEPDPDEAHLHYGIARTIHVIGPDRWYRTCNIAYPRQLLEQLGGFDEELAFHCEDSDLGIRAEQSGAPQVFVDEAVVWHAVHVRSFRQAIADAARIAGEPELLARYPEQRDELYLRVFVSEEHAKLALALAGLLVLPHSRALATLAAYPYVMGRIAKRLRNPNPLSPLGLFRLAGDIAVEGALDTVEVISRARSSLRSRSLVL
jgi:glycosyltransferase involved in cell wall biosynthesis